MRVTFGTRTAIKNMHEIIDPEEIVQELAACLCTEAEIGQWQRGGQFADPWPAF